MTGIQQRRELWKESQSLSILGPSIISFSIRALVDVCMDTHAFLNLILAASSD